jgi:hypothetical protein
MKKPASAPRALPPQTRGPLFHLASAWRAAEDLGGRPPAPAATSRFAFEAAAHPPRRSDDRRNR